MTCREIFSRIVWLFFGNYPILFFKGLLIILYIYSIDFSKLSTSKNCSQSNLHKGQRECTKSSYKMVLRYSLSYKFNIVRRKYILSYWWLLTIFIYFQKGILPSYLKNENVLNSQIFSYYSRYNQIFSEYSQVFLCTQCLRYVYLSINNILFIE